jgi:hypothetical protein
MNLIFKVLLFAALCSGSSQFVDATSLAAQGRVGHPTYVITTEVIQEAWDSYSLFYNKQQYTPNILMQIEHLRLLLIHASPEVRKSPAVQGILKTIVSNVAIYQTKWGRIYATDKWFSGICGSTDFKIFPKFHSQLMEQKRAIDGIFSADGVNAVNAMAKRVYQYIAQLYYTVMYYYLDVSTEIHVGGLIVIPPGFSAYCNKDTGFILTPQEFEAVDVEGEAFFQHWQDALTPGVGAVSFAWPVSDGFGPTDEPAPDLPAVRRGCCNIL